MRMLGLNPTALEVQELVNGLDYEGKRRRNVNINGNVVKRELRELGCKSKTKEVSTKSYILFTSFFPVYQ